MGCNCGKKKKERDAAGRDVGSFVLQTPHGRKQTFGSRLEAEAARVRAGGGKISRT